MKPGRLRGTSGDSRSERIASSNVYGLSPSRLSGLNFRFCYHQLSSTKFVRREAVAQILKRLGARRNRMNILFNLSQKAGLVPTIIDVLIWLACGTVAVIPVGDALWQYPTFAYAFAIAVIAVTGIGGLVGFWLMADHIDFWRLGYRVRLLGANDWVYEERSATPEERSLQYIREVRGRGYPAPCAIWILSQVDWESEAPSWAWGRRSEIVERIANCHGSKLGGEVHILDKS
jgi:hypothetical protein